MDKNSHFTVHGTTTKTSRSDRKAERQYLEIHYISEYSRDKGHTWLRLEHLVVPIISVHGFKELESPTHLCLIEAPLNQTQYTRLQEKLAAYSVERKIVATFLL